MDWKSIGAGFCLLASACFTLGTVFWGSKPSPLGITVEQFQERFNNSIIKYDLSSSVESINLFSKKSNNKLVWGSPYTTYSGCDVELNLLSDSNKINSAVVSVKGITFEEIESKFSCMIVALTAANPQINAYYGHLFLEELAKEHALGNNIIFTKNLDGYFYSFSSSKYTTRATIFVSLTIQKSPK